MSKIKDVFVSAVVIRPEKNTILDFLTQLSNVLASHYAHYEILLITTEPGGSVPDLELNDILQKIKHIRSINLFHDTTDDILFAAGIENAIGDIIVCSYQEFLTEKNVTESVNLCCEGNDVVSGLFRTKKPFWYRCGSNLFRKLFTRILSYNLHPDDAFFRCISRRALNAAVGTRHFHRFVFLRLSNVCEKKGYIDLEISSGRQLHTPHVLESFSKAISLIIFNSTTPLRVMNLSALLVCVIAFFVAVYTVIIKLVKHHVVEGWPTMMLVISFLFFFIFLILAFMGEYLVRIIFDANQAAPYHVLSEKHSSVMLNYDELNVREDSVSSEINLTQTGRDR